MLKQIDVVQLRMGMHLHALDGLWVDHPFWKSRFVIQDPADLSKLRACGIRTCWIDTSLGLDLPEPGITVRPAAACATSATSAASVASAAPVAPALPAAAPPASHGPAAPVSRDLAGELKEAAAVCNKGRQAVISMFNEARMGRAIDTESCLPLVEDITASVMRNPGALVSLARLKTQDDYTDMHSVAVCALMVALARQLGHGADQCRAAGLAGLMHDLGKVMMPVEILNKPGKLTEQEFAIMRSHPVRGHELLAEAKGSSPELLDVCLHHHERVDGTGYPDRLAGDDISLVARMGAVCDVYDAITSNRPYKAGWDPAESIARMASWAGHFDKPVFAAFVQSLGIYPIGSLVRLASDKLAVVVEQNPQALVAPVVKVFFSISRQLHVQPQRVDLSRPGCSDRIVGRESASQWGFTQTDELWAGSDLVPGVRH
ncbi:MAG: HD-GYP domain-containing protein [Rubrivivax sp.]|nr:HD-GYP domain-containing protein [Rubrivivax sp.]